MFTVVATGSTIKSDSKDFTTASGMGSNIFKHAIDHVQCIDLRRQRLDCESVHSVSASSDVPTSPNGRNPLAAQIYPHNIRPIVATSIKSSRVPRGK
jgi:hypothetical protein